MQLFSDSRDSQSNFKEGTRCWLQIRSVCQFDFLQELWFFLSNTKRLETFADVFCCLELWISYSCYVKYMQPFRKSIRTKTATSFAASVQYSFCLEGESAKWERKQPQSKKKRTSLRLYWAWSISMYFDLPWNVLNTYCMNGIILAGRIVLFLDLQCPGRGDPIKDKRRGKRSRNSSDSSYVSRSFVVSPKKVFFFFSRHKTRSIWKQDLGNIWRQKKHCYAKQELVACGTSCSFWLPSRPKLQSCTRKRGHSSSSRPKRRFGVAQFTVRSLAGRQSLDPLTLCRKNTTVSKQHQHQPCSDCIDHLDPGDEAETVNFWPPARQSLCIYDLEAMISSFSSNHWPEAICSSLFKQLRKRWSTNEWHFLK